MNWTSAQVFCSVIFKDLAIISTKDKNQRAVRVSGQNSIWIGLTRPLIFTNIWLWSVDEQPNFTKWMPGGPLGLSAEKNCALTSWGWNDANCTTKYSSCVTKDSHW